MQVRRTWIRRGDPAIWLSGSGLGICLLMIGGMIGLILTNGLGFFWPRPVAQVSLHDGTVVVGEIVNREAIPAPGAPAHLTRFRVQLKMGNRDLSSADFRWIDESAVARTDYPVDLLYVERREYGPFIGRAVRLMDGEREITSGAARVADALGPLVAQAARDRAAIRVIERGQIAEVNAAIERERLRLKALDRAGARGGYPDAQRDERSAVAQRTSELKARYGQLELQLSHSTEQASQLRVLLQAADGTEKAVPVIDLYRVYAPNGLSALHRVRVYASRLWEFLWADPRESNTEGGVFPAIFGTVMMVFLMSLLAVPFGVVAAIYLREYARQGVLVRIVRIAVNNLAGVPSIVFGVFGLGFFVYLVGGAIDQTFYAERLPTPTFGTGGILWASLTLGLLTVPVVIVAAEEALSTVPRSMREASLATGATKFQTLLHVVLPAAAPGILTGFILAMARGAGEVAPLMITGVVKLAPDLPVDGIFPFVHLERKFMHLGFHIYDVGFQSPNVEAAKPMVYATAILLLAIVILLNVTAIVVRNRLRRRYQMSAF
jgi:phosphate transport system permease protein